MIEARLLPSPQIRICAEQDFGMVVAPGIATFRSAEVCLLTVFQFQPSTVRTVVTDGRGEPWFVPQCWRST